MEISYPTENLSSAESLRVFAIKAALGHATLKAGYVSDAEIIASAKSIEDYITNGK